MVKYRILVAPSDRAGSGKFRSLDPHLNLQKNYSDEFFVDINYKVDFNDNDYLKTFQAIHIHRLPQHHSVNAVKILENLKKLGLKIILDVDDYWYLDPSHGSYEAVKRDGLVEILVNCMKMVHMVTVPTEILANEVKKYNKNVVILPNAIDPTESQFIPKPIESHKTRFGILCGSSHIRDIELLRGIPFTGNDYLDKIQMVLCGFDLNGVVREINPKTGETKERAMRPQETVWFMYELFLTNSYKLLENDVQYLTFLTKFIKDVNIDDKNKPYRRIWTKPVNEYATGYNEFDVLLAPLVDNSFNKYKSALKIAEAGFHKKALIAQNYGAHQIDLISYYDKGGKINPNGNCLLVEPSKNHKQWQQHVKKLVSQPELIKELGERLYDTVKDKYDINNVTKERRNYYLKLLK